jgi:hypothetical protein
MSFNHILLYPYTPILLYSYTPIHLFYLPYTAYRILCPLLCPLLTVTLSVTYRYFFRYFVRYLPLLCIGSSSSFRAQRIWGTYGMVDVLLRRGLLDIRKGGWILYSGHGELYVSLCCMCLCVCVCMLCMYVYLLCIDMMSIT